jgi:hypothetical protein
MVQTNTVLFGWNRAIAGREGMAAELFTHVVSFYEKLKSTNQLESYEAVFLNRHGGDLNGFFLLKGTHAQLDSMLSSDEFVTITMRAEQYLDGVGVITGYTGALIPDLMQRWMKTIPSR